MAKQRVPKKENKTNASLHLFSPIEGMTVLETLQSWRGDERLDEWQDHFLSSLVHRMYSAGHDFELTAEQVEKLDEIREVIELPPGTEPWQQAQKAARRRLASGAPLASNLWWEK